MAGSQLCACLATTVGPGKCCGTELRCLVSVLHGAQLGRAWTEPRTNSCKTWLHGTCAAGHTCAHTCTVAPAKTCQAACFEARPELSAGRLQSTSQQPCAVICAALQPCWSSPRRKLALSSATSLGRLVHQQASPLGEAPQAGKLPPCRSTCVCSRPQPLFSAQPSSPKPGWKIEYMVPQWRLQKAAGCISAPGAGLPVRCIQAAPPRARAASPAAAC